MDRIENKLKTSGRVVTDPALNAYVRQIVCKLDPVRCTDLRIYIVDTPHFNASMAPNGCMQVWTVDGPLLEALRFVTLNDGDTLFLSSDEEAKLPRFRAHMTPNEVVEFFVASLKSVSGGVDTHQLAKGMVLPAQIRAGSINAASIDVKNLRPTDFGRLPGFRFDFSFLSKEGLERQGIALGCIHEGKLLLVVYTGTKEYYFEKHKQDVETIFSSVEIVK